MDEELEAALMRAGQQIEQLQRQCEILRAERDQARASVDSAVKLLTGIHSCMYHGAVKMEDGRLMVFRPENPHEYMQALSDRIRALPDEIAKLADGRQGVHGDRRPGRRLPQQHERTRRWRLADEERVSACARCRPPPHRR